MFKFLMNFFTIRKCKKCGKFPQIKTRFLNERTEEFKKITGKYEPIHSLYEISCCGIKFQFLDTQDLYLNKPMKKEIKSIKKSWNKAQI